MKKLIYLDSCHPDYFQGYGGQTLIAFHWKGQTVHEAIANLEHNALNEGHDGETFEAIENFKKNYGSNRPAINENYCEFDENGDSGLVHYFGLQEESGVMQ